MLGRMIDRRLLLLPRFFLGTIFAVAVFAKLKAGSALPAMIAGFAQHAGTPIAPYKAFVDAVVVPNAGLFAAMVVAGELYVAVAMLAGLTTRLAAAVAVFLLFNYMLAKGMTPWTPASNDAADIVLAIVVGVGAAGRCAGLDRFLATRWPRVPLW